MAAPETGVLHEHRLHDRRPSHSHQRSCSGVWLAYPSQEEAVGAEVRRLCSGHRT